MDTMTNTMTNTMMDPTMDTTNIPAEHMLNKNISNSTPIILLHGLGSHPVTMNGIKFYLKYCGFTEIHNLAYPANTLNLEDATNHINDQLNNLINKIDHIIIIGQSVGGLIGCLLHRYGWNVELLITIGSPVKGALAVKYIRDSAPQIIKNVLHKPMYDNLIQMLETPLQEPTHKYHCFTMGWFNTLFDGCVYIDEARFTKEHHTHLCFSDHRSIFANPRLWYNVHQCILNYSD